MFTKAELEALASLGVSAGDDEMAVLAAGAREAMRRREQNSVDGGAVIAGMVQRGATYRDVEALTDIPHVTAWRWATPPKEADKDRAGPPEGDAGAPGS